IYNPRFGGGFCFLNQQLVRLPVVTALIFPPAPLPGGTTGVVYRLYRHTEAEKPDLHRSI
ncbi:hypothetical protein ACS6JN_14700, partial [Enterobacter hormaechei subsp. steigerwaltii]|uniref:hypothetical protein n=1 Tax=Enterobacter hormaechei TaxID=158836 RepID=UPI003F423C02